MYLVTIAIDPVDLLTRLLGFLIRPLFSFVIGIIRAILSSWCTLSNIFLLPAVYASSASRLLLAEFGDPPLPHESDSPII